MYAVKPDKDSKAIDRKQILRHIPQDGVDTVSLSVYLGGIAVPVLRSLLQEMAAEGQIEALEDDRWKPCEKPLRLVVSNNPEVYSSRLNELESEITQIGKEIRLSFYEIGVRLKEISDSFLYREKGFTTFELYVKETFGFSASYAYKKIAATQAYLDIQPLCTICPQTLSESVLRPIAQDCFTEDDRREIWEEVQAELSNEENSGKEPKLTAKKVKRAAIAYLERQITNPPRLPDLEIGTLCLVKLKVEHADSDLKKYEGKLVKVTQTRDYGDRQGVACQTPWGVPILQPFYREELQEVGEDYRHRETIDIPLKVLQKIARFGTDLSSAIVAVSQIIED